MLSNSGRIPTPAGCEPRSRGTAAEAVLWVRQPPAMHEITFNDCSVCRKCCIFSPSESCEAPLVTPEHRDRLLADFPQLSLHFEPAGELWQLQLVPGVRPGQRRCPLHEPAAGKCLTHADKPMNCQFYPFYLVRNGASAAIAYTPLCPVVRDEVVPSLIEHLRRGLGALMYQAARHHEGMILESRPDALFICEIDRFRPPVPQALG